MHSDRKHQTLEEEKDTKRLVAWLDQVFYPNKQYDDGIPCLQLADLIVKQRISSPIFQNLLLLGYELLSFHPRRRPTAEEAFTRIQRMMKVPFSCPSGPSPPELKTLNQQETTELFKLGWIKDQKVRTLMLSMCGQVWTFFIESDPQFRPLTLKKALILLKDINHLLLATRQLYETEKKLPEQNIPSLFIWLLSLLISGGE